MPRVGWVVQGEKVSDAEVLDRAERDGSFFRFPLAAWQMLIRQTRREGGYLLSPSSADRCPRSSLLRASEPYWLDPEKTWPLLRGAAWHRMLDPGPSALGTSLSEETLSLMLPVPVAGHGLIDIPLVGTPDHYTASQQRLEDFKTIGSWEYFNTTTRTKTKKELPDPSHVMQLNLYALLLESHGFPVKQAHLWYFQDASGCPRKIVPVPLWSEEDRYAMAIECATPLAQTLATGGLPSCICRFPGYGLHTNLCARPDTDAWSGLPQAPPRPTPQEVPSVAD